MKPIDIRNHNFSELRNLLRDDRLEVWAAWLRFEGTTREVSAFTGIDILTFRPRTTELYKAGLVMLVDHQAGPGRVREGVYRARTEPEWEAWKLEQLTHTGKQMQLV